MDRERAARGSGTRLTPNVARRPDPAIPGDVTGGEIDFTVKRELRTLSKENATGVAAHLVMVGRLLDVDLEGAQAHAETAVRRAGRVASVREARGLVAYRAGDWALALSEFRTARRLAGDHHLLPLMVDCERGLGRPQRALELATGPEATTLAASEQMELRIVVSGIRRDLGQVDAALIGLRGPQLDPSKRLPWSPRLFYAYADALLESGDEIGARQWFAHAAAADAELETDAAERLEEIDGVLVVDLLEGQDDESEENAASDGNEDSAANAANDETAADVASAVDEQTAANAVNAANAANDETAADAASDGNDASAASAADAASAVNEETAANAVNNETAADAADDGNDETAANARRDTNDRDARPRGSDPVDTSVGGADRVDTPTGVSDPVDGEAAGAGDVPGGGARRDHGEGDASDDDVIGKDTPEQDDVPGAVAGADVAKAGETAHLENSDGHAETRP